MAAGGELAGLRVNPGRAAIVSEESLENWKARCQKLHMGKHLSFFCRPFRTKPSAVQWEGLMQAMITLRRREGLDLVVIDPLAAFLPGDNENTAAVVLRTLQPLRDLTAVGLSVLLLHHPRKGATALGQAARGSGALPSHVDILLEMHWNQNPQNEDRRRRLHAFSRHDQTRRHAVIELAADGADYTMTALLPGMETTETWDALFLVLGDANEPLTQKKIRQAWPDDFARPDRSTIVRLLGRGLEENRIRRKGTGRKNDPYRYWMPEAEDRFNPGPNATPEQKARYNLHWQKTVWEAAGLDSSRITLEQFTPKNEPDPEPEPAVATQGPTPEPEPAAQESKATPDPEPPPVPAAPAMPIMPPSPTEYTPVKTAPLPPGIMRPPPPVDEAAVARERLRLRRWPV
jgi:hypothetical protein